MACRHRRQWFVLMLCWLAIVAEVRGVAQEGAARTWTSADGQFKVQAQLVELQQGAVRLKKEDGRIVTVPLDRLSAADREYVRRLASATPAVKPPATIPGGAPATDPTAPGPKFAGSEAEIAALLTPDWPTEYRRVRELDVPAGGVASVSFSGDGSRLITTGRGGDCCVWEVETGQQVSAFAQRLTGSSFCAALSLDGKIGAVGGGFKQVHLFNAETGALLRSHDAEGAVTSVAFSDDGKWAFAADEAGNVMRLPVKAGAALVKNVDAKPLSRFAVSPDGEAVVAGPSLVTFPPGARDGYVQRFGSGAVGSMSAGGRRFVSASKGDCFVSNVQDARDKTQGHLEAGKSEIIGAHFTGIDHVAMTRDGRRFVGFSSSEQSAIYVDLDYQELVCRTPMKLPIAHEAVFEFGPDLLTVAQGEKYGKVSLWQLAEFPRTRELRLAQTAHEWLLAKEYDKLEALDAWLLAHPGVIEHSSAARQQGLLVESLGRHWNGEIIEHLPRLKSWQTARPKSALARLCLAEHYAYLAWMIRGGGFAATVPENAMRQFGVFTQSAFDTLAPLLEGGKAPPCAYEVVFKMAMAHSWDEDKVEPYIAQLLKIDPAYYPAHEQIVLMRLPRWGGEAGDSAAYAARIADQVGGPDGDAVYARLGVYLRRYFRLNEFLDQTKFDYDRIQRGLARLQAQAPDDPWAFMEAMTCAALKDDKATGKTAQLALAALEEKHPWWTLSGGISDQVFEVVTYPIYMEARKWGKNTVPPTNPGIVVLPPNVPIIPDPSPLPPRFDLPPLPADAVDASVAPVHWECYGEVPSDANRPIDVSPDGMLAQASGHDICLWNVFTGKRERVYRTSRNVEDVQLANGGKTLVGRVGDTLFAANSETGEVLGKYEYPKRTLLGRFTCSTYGNTLLICGKTQAQIFSLPALQEPRVVEISESGSLQAVSPDGAFVALTASGQIDIYDAAEGKLQHQERGRIHNFAPDGRLLFDYFQKFQMFDVAEKIAQPIGPVPANLSRAWIDPARKLLFCTNSRSGQVEVLDLASAAKVGEFLVEEGPVYSMYFLPEGKGFVTRVQNKGYRIWAAKKGAGG